MAQPSVNVGLGAIDQISLSASDLEVAERFYCGVLGLEMAGSAPPGMKFFGCAGVNLIVTKGEKIWPASIIYFKVDGVAGLIQEKFAALRAAGVEVENEPNCIARNWHGKDVWLAFFRDPFGNRLALKSDVPGGGTAATGPKLARIAPCFLVADAEVSAAFYREKLGFKVDLIEGKEFAIVRSDGDQQIFLKRAAGAGMIAPNRSRVSGGATYDAYIFTRQLADVGALEKQLRAAGVDVKRTDWAAGENEEFRVRDADGYELVFAHGK